MEPLTGEALSFNEYGSYREYKAAVDTELQRSAENFVRIGYLLKVARDTDILKESGYGSVNEFAEAEYSLDKSQVSRFIRINDEYSGGGYSDRLQAKYRAFGYAKLSLMLTLPAAVNEELTADYTKSEIQTIKNEIDAEKQKTDIEVMLEEKDVRQQEYTLFGKVLYQLGHDDPQLYVELHDTVYRGADRTGKLADVLAPAGEAVRSVRIAGEGRKLLCIRGTDADPAVIDVRSGDKASCTWDDLAGDMEALYMTEDAEESWKLLYGEEFPRKEKAAPVQPDRGAGQPPKKPKRVHVSKPEKPGTTGGDSGLTEDVKQEYKESGGQNRKEEEQDCNEKEEVAPVQPENDTENMQNDTAGDRISAGGMPDVPDTGGRIPEEAPDSAHPAPPRVSAAGAEPADDASGTGGNAGAGAADVEDGTGLKAEPAAAGIDTETTFLAERNDGQIEISDIPGSTPDNRAAEQMAACRQTYLAALRDNMDKIYIMTERGEYDRAESWLDTVRGTIHKIRDTDRERSSHGEETA